FVFFFSSRRRHTRFSRDWSSDVRSSDLPITEDRDWDYANRFELATAAHADRYNIIEGFTTARLNFNRENRFYGSVAFDGAKWFIDRKSTRLNSSHVKISYAVFCLKKKTI